MSEKCFRVHPDLLAFLDGDLEESRRGQVKDHLGGCAGCRRELDALRRVMAMLREETGREEFEPSPGFQREFWRRLERERERGGFAGRLWERVSSLLEGTWASPLRIPALATAAVALLVLLTTLAIEPEPSTPAPAELEIAGNLELFQDFEIIRDLDLLLDYEVIKELEVEES